MSTPKPPKQLRVTLKQQFDYDYNDDGTHTKTEAVPLGYAIPYAPTTKAYPKQMKSQDDWAYGQGHNAGAQSYFVDADGKYWSETSRWQPKAGFTYDEARAMAGGSGFETIVTKQIFEDRFQPIIVDNVPLEGFRIQHMVARYKGNKLWRILDPRGFELEIASGTFEDIVMSGVVDRGLIVGPCIWQSQKKLVRV